MRDPGTLDFDAHGDDEEEEDFSEPEESREQPVFETTPEAMPSPPIQPRRSEPRQSPAPTNGRRSAPKAKIRVRAMPAELKQKWPKVCSMLITNDDNSQILFVRNAQEG